MKSQRLTIRQIYSERRRLHRRLVELDRLELSLRRKKSKKIRGVPPESKLIFNVSKRTVTCEGQAVKLGSKSFLFLKTIWDGTNHRADFDTIEQKVWGERGKKIERVTEIRRNGLPHRVSQTCEFPNIDKQYKQQENTQKVLEKKSLPIKINSFKNPETLQNEGFAISFLQ
jgi:hypothetical protein